MKEYREFPKEKDEPRFLPEVAEEIARETEKGESPLEEYELDILDRAEAGMYQKKIDGEHIRIVDQDGKVIFFTNIKHYELLEEARKKRRALPEKKSGA